MQAFALKNLVLSGRWLSFAMLVTLHVALLVGTESLWMRPVMLMHLGMFLLWQPLWRGESKLHTGGAAFIIVWNLVATTILLKLISFIVPLRASDGDVEGGDLAIHGIDPIPFPTASA